MRRFSVVLLLLFFAGFYNNLLAEKTESTPDTIKQTFENPEIGLIENILTDDKFDVRYHIDDESEDVNNAYVELYVTGGKEPYTYKWSDKGTSLQSSIARDLSEGRPVTVTIFDSNLDTVFLEILIPATSSTEKINGIFTPIVEIIEDVLFWDPFTYFGLYDNVIYDKDGKPYLHPNGEKKTTEIPFIVVWLILGAIFFTVKMRFINFRGFKHAINLISGKFDNPNDTGEVSHFQALTTALSATVGLGNIAGVAIAISLGGPGATFWMIIAGFLGMSSKFVECTLGVKYREIDKDGVVSGGPMYYLSKGLKLRKMGGLGKVLALIFAVS